MTASILVHALLSLIEQGYGTTSSMSKDARGSGRNAVIACQLSRNDLRVPTRRFYEQMPMQPGLTPYDATKSVPQSGGFGRGYLSNRPSVRLGPGADAAE